MSTDCTDGGKPWVVTNSRWGGTRAREQIPMSKMLNKKQFKTMMKGSDISQQLADFLREILPVELVVKIFSALVDIRGGILYVDYNDMATLEFFNIKIYHEYAVCKEVQTPVGFADGLVKYKETTEWMAVIYGADFGMKRGSGWRLYDEPVPYDFVVACINAPCDIEVHEDEEYHMIGSRKRGLIGTNFAVNVNLWEGQAKCYVELEDRYLFLDSSDCYFSSGCFEYRGADVAGLTVYAIRGEFCVHTTDHHPLREGEEYNDDGYRMDYDPQWGVTLTQGECALCDVEAMEIEEPIWEGSDDEDDGLDFGP